MKRFVKLVKESTLLSPTRQVQTQIDVNNAQVSRDGLRAVDSGMFTISSSVPTLVGDEFKYIQDIADTSHLRGAYLFQGTALDESGYNVDPRNQTLVNDNIYEGMDFVLNSTSGDKFRGFYGGTVPNSNSKGLWLENKFLEDGTTPVHDFSGNFDIVMWIKAPPTYDSGFKCLYNKSDKTTPNGSGTGISIVLSRGNSSYYKALVYMQNTTGSTDSVSSGYKIPVDGNACIRVRRKGSVVDLWVVNGTESVPFGTPDDTDTGVSGSLQSSKEACIGNQPSTWSGNTITGVNTYYMMKGKFYSLRIYCGGTLDALSADQLYSSRPIPLVMKLAGTLWKIEESIDEKKLYVKGYGKIITDTLISTQLMTAATPTGEFYDYGGSRSGTSFTDATSAEMIRAIMAKINATLAAVPTFKLSVNDLTGIAAKINNYNAQGNFLEIINQLMIIIDRSFYVSPRGKCIIESKDIPLENSLIFKEKGYNISGDGFDDSTTVNDLYVSTRAGGNFNIVRTLNQPSIDNIGLYSKRILAPQITDATSATQFATNFIANQKDINTRYTIKAPFLLDFVRENFQVKVVNSIKSLDVTSTIKSISWYYPEGKTTIETGDFLLDAFDMEKTSAEAISNLVTDTNLNP